MQMDHTIHSPHPSLAVLIPALNEEASLPLVLQDLPAQVTDVLVVDNHSTDRTAEVARAHGACVVGEPQRGYGAACLRGLVELAQRPEGPPEIVVFLDADHSDHPEELPLLLQPILDQEAEFVLGSRLLGQREPGAMPPQSVWGNRLACWLMRVLFGARYTDLGPFRAIRWSALERLGMVDRNYGWTVEMQIKAARLGLRTREMPVSYRRRIGTSKISGTIRGTILAGSKILYLIGLYGLTPVRPGISAPSRSLLQTTKPVGEAGGDGLLAPGGLPPSWSHCHTASQGVCPEPQEQIECRDKQGGDREHLPQNPLAPAFHARYTFHSREPGRRQGQLHQPQRPG